MIDRIDEQDELLLNRLLDGELANDEAVLLQARLDREPGLKRVYEQLVRLETTLADRAQQTPMVAWAPFHDRIMRALQEEAPAKKTIRFPVWLRVSAPMAAAAAVVLAVLLHHPADQPSGSNVPRVIVHQPQPIQPLPIQLQPTRAQPVPTLVVQFQRPNVPPASPNAKATSTDVAYTRSQELQEAIRDIDKKRESSPSWRLYTVHGVDVDLNISDISDEPPS